VNGVPGRPRPALWRHRDFLLLWGGQAISEVGSAVTVLALPLTAVVVLHASTFQVGVLSALATAAFLLIALPAGAVVDRLAKRKLMMACDAARMVIVGSVPLAAALGALSMGQLYAVALAAGVGTVLFDVAYMSYVPLLVQSSQLTDANGKLQTTAEAARIAGPGLGGVLVGLIGAAGAMAADAISYAVSVGSLLLIRTPEPARSDPARSDPAASDAGRRHEAAGPRRPAARSGRWQELTAGLSFIFREPILRKIVACTGTANLFGSMISALQIIFLVRVLHVRPAYTGLVVALSALGGVAGGAASGPLARRIGSARIIWVSILGLGPAALLIPLAQPGLGVLLYVAGWASYAFSGVLYNVAQLSYRQAICPPELLGRMNAAVRWIVWGTLPLGGLLGGVLGTVLGIRPTLWVAAVGAWAAGLWVFFSPLRRMRDIPGPGLSPPHPTGTGEILALAGENLPPAGDGLPLGGEGLAGADESPAPADESHTAGPPGGGGAAGLTPP
jgi:MFS family permease